LARSKFEEEVREFEDILQKVAGEIANGMLSEKLPPSELLKKQKITSTASRVWQQPAKRRCSF